MWNSANLTPLKTPDDGVRPVAVGDTLRRLIGKVLLSTNTAKGQVQALTPTQVGVGVRSTAESVAMGFTNLVETLGVHTQWVALQVDLSNAFNSISRKAILTQAQRLTPALYNYLRFAYHSPAPLFLPG